MLRPTRTKPHNGFTRFVLALFRHKWPVSGLLFLIGSTLTAGVYLTQFETNYRIFFSKANPELREYEEFETTYGKYDSFIYVIEPTTADTVFTNATLSAVCDLTERSWYLPYVTRVDSICNFQMISSEADQLIRQQLIVDLGRIPADALLAKRSVALAEPLIAGLLITGDATAAAVIVVAEYPHESPGEIVSAVNEARRLRDQIKRSHPEQEVYLTGTSLLSVAVVEAVKSDLMFLVPLMALVVTVAIFLVLRSPSHIFITLLLVALSCGSSMGLAAILGITMAGPTPTAAVVVMTLAVADSVHVLTTVRRLLAKGYGRRSAVIRAVRINCLPISLTSITTITAFLCLNFADSPPFQDFGNVTAIGVGVAWLLSLVLLPALLDMHSSRPSLRDERDVAALLLGRVASMVSRYNRAVLIVTLILAASLSIFIVKLTFNDQFQEYFDESSEFSRETGKATDLFGFFTMELSIEAGSENGIQERSFLVAVDSVAEWLRQDERVVHVHSIVDTIKELNKSLHEGDSRYYDLPEDSAHIAQLLLLYEVLIPQGHNLQDRVSVDGSATRLTATLDGKIDSREIRELVEDIEKRFFDNSSMLGGFVTGPHVLFANIGERNLESLLFGMVIAVVAIAFVIMMTTKSVEIGVLSIVTNVLPIVVTFGAWGLLVEEVGFSIAIAGTISFGIVVDGTVHLLISYVRVKRRRGLSAGEAIRRAMSTVGIPIVSNTIILAAGFIVLSTSAFKVNADLGLLTTMAIVFALIFDFFLLPAILIAKENWIRSNRK